MRLLIESGSTRIGGAENFICRLAKALRRFDDNIIIDAVVLTSRGDLDALFREVFDSVYYLCEGTKTLDNIMANGYDIFQAIDSFDSISNIASYYKDIAFIQNVFPDLSESVYAPSLNWIVNGSKHYNAIVTEIYKNASFLIPPGRFPHLVRVIKNAIDISFWSCYEEKPRRHDVCWVGRAEPAKGVDTLVDLIKSSATYSFNVVFNEPTEPWHSVLCGLRKDPSINLTYKYSLSREELKNIYCDSKIYLHTSKSEGQPGTLLEAMGCGCIPVCVGVGGVAEVVNQGPYRNGFLIHRDRVMPSDIMGVINECFRNFDMRAMSQQSFSYVAQYHNITSRADEYYTLYKEVIKNEKK